MTGVVLTRAEQGFSNSIEATLERINRFGKIVQDAMEYQTVTGYIEDIADLVSDFKIDLERVIAERQKLEAEISQLRSNAAWEADAARERAAEWERASWK